MKSRKHNGMNNFWRFAWTLALATSLSAADRTDSAATAKAMKESVARQKEAVAAMAGSLEAQRRSVQGQLSRMPARPFFQRSSFSPPFATPPCPPLGTSELEPL